VDTTAAGDSFVGALAVGCAEGREVEAAVPIAVAAGTLAVTRFGAQPSIPTREEVENFIS
jgi:ribokinase